MEEAEVAAEAPRARAVAKAGAVEAPGAVEAADRVGEAAEGGRRRGSPQTGTPSVSLGEGAGTVRARTWAPTPAALARWSESIAVSSVS